MKLGEGLDEMCRSPTWVGIHKLVDKLRALSAWPAAAAMPLKLASDISKAEREYLAYQPPRIRLMRCERPRP